MITAPQIIAAADLASVAVPTGLTAVAGCVLTALGFLLRARLAVKAEHREDRREDQEKRRDDQSDTASLLNSQRIALDGAFKREESLRRRLDAQDRRIAELTEQLDVERRERDEQRSHYEHRIGELGQQLADVMRQLDELRDQLHPEGDT